MDEVDDEQFDPAEAERQISAFIDEADRLPGPAVGTLADGVESLVGDAQARIAALLGEVVHNKVLATMLLLSQRARTTDAHDARHWRLNAASTLVSGYIVPTDTGPGARPGQ